MVVPYLSLHFLDTGSVKQGFHMNWTVVLEHCGSMTNTSVYALKDTQDLDHFFQSCKNIQANGASFYATISCIHTAAQQLPAWGTTQYGVFWKPWKSFGATLDFSGRCISLIVDWCRSPPWCSSWFIIQTIPRTSAAWLGHCQMAALSISQEVCQAYK